jgi:hypothetical protein
VALTVGSRLGGYEITASIGEGGMGHVYRARDTKLHRDVALKVLPDAFASDSDRLARFTREARTLASLNHSNIAHIHGLEESGQVRAIIMEIVEGEVLSRRIARGALPLDQALPIAKQIADALEAAHEHARRWGSVSRCGLESGGCFGLSLRLDIVRFPLGIGPVPASGGTGPSGFYRVNLPMKGSGVTGRRGYSPGRSTPCPPCKSHSSTQACLVRIGPCLPTRTWRRWPAATAR